MSIWGGGERSPEFRLDNEIGVTHHTETVRCWCWQQHLGLGRHLSWAFLEKKMRAVFSDSSGSISSG